MEEVLEESLERWYLATKYSNKSFGLKFDNGYTAHIVTSFHEEDDNVTAFDVPVLLHKEKVVLMYLKGADLKSNMNVYDEIEEFISPRGRGRLKINCARLMVLNTSDGLGHLKKDMMNIYTKLIASIFNKYLSLDRLDMNTIEDNVILYYIHTNWFMDKESKLELFRLSSKHSELKDDYIENFFNEDFKTIVDALHYGISNGTVNRRLSNTTKPTIEMLLQTILFKDSIEYVEKSFNSLPIFMALCLESVSNLFFKKSHMGVFLSSKEKLLDVKNITKQIDNLVK